MTLFVAFAALVARLSFVCFAATVTDITDQVSSTQISVGSNHKFIMTVADAVSEGQTMTIAFPLAFTLSSETEDDVDVDDDGVDLTTAADCSGSEHMSVAITGQTITMTVCAGDGGAIANGSVVTIEIGTNASASGSGTQRITNPATVGSWFLAVGGTSGISGSVLLTTSTYDGAGVTATVSPTEPSSSGSSPVDPGDSCSSRHGESCTSSANSCGMTNSGSIFCDGSCSAVPPSDADCPTSCSASAGEGCASSANSCGMTNSGFIACDGSCSASVPNDDECPTTTCSAREGESCTSSANSCGMTNSGTIGCSGSCSAAVPDETFCEESTCSTSDGESCTSSANSCGMTNSGTIGCSGSCSAEMPEDSLCATSDSCVAQAGDSCTTSANACDMVNTGTIACDGTCSATAPTDDLCASEPGSCVESEGDVCMSSANSCGMTNGGTIGCSGVCSAQAPVDSLCAPAVVPEESSGPSGTSASPSGSGPEAEAVAGFSRVIEEIRTAPEIRRVVGVATPIALVAAAVSIAVLATSFHLLSYLQFLFTSPFLFFSRRKRKAFGVVYNAITKIAVDLATVRLFDVATQRLVRSVVTDAQGKYFFVVNPGRYRMTVTKHGFTFPSMYLRDTKDDGVFLDVYTGQDIEVTEKDATIAANIPLDSADVGDYGSQAAAKRTRLLQKVLSGFSVFGVALSIGVWILSPSGITMVLAMVQVGVYVLFWRLAKPRRPRGWGIVYDASNHRPVGNAVVRLFEPKYNKLVETALTDTLGRYSFLVGPNEYFVRTDKEGYDQHIIRPIDYRQKTEPDAIAFDVPLTPTTRL